ncbi:unnamed protein product [Aspergillus oryzae]|nr:unnamed protein product [Aspergillus oryzae]GMF85653.1 unnamed protein product [Aspergillus oryzae]GMG04460.1 unnamed protein product [Aspergillus oryzae]
MSVVSLLGVKIQNNPAPFLAPYQFEITFECLEQLQKDLLLTDSNRSEYDQELDSLFVGPIPVGVNKFIFEAEAPDLKRIPTSEILGVTVILLTCSYDGREFVRVGYYVNNEYDSEDLSAEPPAKPIIERIRRNILAEKPRVTRFAIKWDSEESAPAEYPPDQPEADILEDDSAAYGAEEAELEAALVRELADAERDVKSEDHEMEGAEPAIKEEEEEDISDAESEDIEDESDDDEEDLDEEEAGDGDEDVEMGDDSEQKDDGPKADSTNQHSHQPEVMVH